MNIDEPHRNNLSKAYGLFIEAFRPYAVSLLQPKYHDKWEEGYKTCLTPVQLTNWETSLKTGSNPETLIDYSNLKSFSLTFKELLRKDFQKEVNKLPTQLETIYDIRNKLAHYSDIHKDEFNQAFILMKGIARILKMDELEQELNTLHNLKEKQKSEKQTSTLFPDAKKLPWFQVVTPHLDIRQGRLDESIFAANLAEVALGNGREIYNNPVMFFTKTYFTSGIKSIAKTVINGLNGLEEADNRVISLQTGFGGGKTHALISLYHICKSGKNVEKITAAQPLLAYTGLPKFEKANISVFTNTTNDPANGRTVENGIHIRTLWGELAYQLGGKKGYEIIRNNDEQRIAPGGTFKQVLQQFKPALILIDELADYCVKAAGIKVGDTSLADQTISFMQELTQAVSETTECVAVITLPASPEEVGNTPEAQAILSSLQKRVSRVGADTLPVAEDEIFEVIRRRLFEDAGSPEQIEAIASDYLSFYQQYKTELPDNASRSAYKQRIIKSYPFHPELIDIFRVRWASHHDFQRTRGVLRLLAAIISDLWKRRQSLPGNNLLIHSGQINLSNLDALTAQIKKLYGNGYDAVISADVTGPSANAVKIDNEKPEFGSWHLTESIATVILLNSFGSEGANKGLSIQDIKLQVLIPDGFNHNNINGALDELESKAYYLYYTQGSGGAKRYWFYTKPNINILINQAKDDLQLPELNAEIISLLNAEQNKITNPLRALINPAMDIPEQKSPVLLILHPQYAVNPEKINGSTKKLIESVATKKGSSERIYRNTMLFLVCSEMGLANLQESIRSRLACKKIETEYGSQLEKEQKEDIKRRIEDAKKEIDNRLSGAYPIVVKHTSKNGLQKLIISEVNNDFSVQVNQNIVRSLKENEWLLDAVGFNTLKNNNLIPNPEHSKRVKDVYEAFLRFDDKPMITGQGAIANSLMKYCMNGEYSIATGDGTNFTRFYYKESIPFFDVSDETYWLVDKTKIPSQGSSGSVTSPGGAPSSPNPVTSPSGTPVPASGAPVKQFKSLTISGKVPLENYTDLFSSFINPFVSIGNKVDIEINFSIKSTQSSPIDESMQQFKNAKESASQLGLNFAEEEDGKEKE